MLPSSSVRSAVSRLAPVRRLSISAPSSLSIASTRWSIIEVSSGTAGFPAGWTIRPASTMPLTATVGTA